MTYIAAGFVALSALIMLFPIHVLGILALVFWLGRRSK